MPTSTARLTLIIAATLGTSVALAAHRTYDKRLDAPPGGELTLRADVGSVAVVGSDGSEVVVHADLEGSDSFLSDFHIDAGATSSGVNVSARRTRKDWSGRFGDGSTRVQFRIEVPRNYRVDLQTAGGGLDVRELNAAVRAVTSGGSALVQDIAGTVEVRSSGGSIDARNLKGSSQLITSGGEVSVADSTGDLKLNTSGGSIRIRNDDGKIDAHTSGGSIRAQLPANHGINLSTSAGSINLMLPRDTHAALDAETSAGRVTSGFPLSATDISEKEHLRGAIGGSGAEISLHTSAGDIRLEPR
ncbi:MAG TPA: DUF4097 family beta strand repeat-containing protein [Steroidobacteraceae bacterium]|jgi:hypothetical protein|nr:DUF4097 family beta strand repeat-containing protein [Steroidobacteraceae bacterium]